MTDIGGGICSLLVTAAFLKFWRPRALIEYAPPPAHAAIDRDAPPLTVATVCRAWAPFALMSVFLMGSGLVRQQEAKVPVFIGSVQTNYKIPIEGLHKQVARAAELQEPDKPTALETAEFNFAWVTAPGTPVMLAALASMVLLRVRPAQAARVLRQTVWQMRIPIPTIAFRHRRRQQRAVRQPAKDHRHADLQRRRVHPLGVRPGAGVGLHSQQHGRGDGQNDRRPEHLRGDGGDRPGRPRGGHLQGSGLAQHRAGGDRRAADTAASVCAAVHADGAQTVVLR
jgi:hypothetical protein